MGSEAGKAVERRARARARRAARWEREQRARPAPVELLTGGDRRAAAAKQLRITPSAGPGAERWRPRRL
jgi:hypothetical protein